MASLRKAFAAQNGVCCYCDGATWLRGGGESKRAALKRLGIPQNQPFSRKMLLAATATREHLIRRADGGKNGNGNIVMACEACNVRRGESTPERHRADMQALVALGLHPTNRKGRPVEDCRSHIRNGRRALREIKAASR